MHSVDNAASILKRATLASAEFSAGPAGVDQPAVDVVLSHTFGQHLSVAAGVKDDEGCTVAGGEGWDRLQDTVLGTRSLRSVTSQEVVAGLLRGEAGDGREDTEGIASEHDDVTRLTVDDAGNLGVGNVFDGVGAASVLGDADVIVVRRTSSGVVDDILEDGTELDSVEDIGLLLGREVDALSVATTFDVEDASVGPDVLIITDQETVRVGREGGLASTGEAEEESNITLLLADIGRGMKRKLAELDGLKVMLEE